VYDPKTGKFYNLNNNNNDGVWLIVVIIGIIFFTTIVGKNIAKRQADNAAASQMLGETMQQSRGWATGTKGK
jgi:hypothetical protein